MKDLKIVVAGTGYVGLSIATLLSQHHHVTAVDIVEEKVEKIVEQQAVERADSSNDYVFVNGKMIKRESNTTDSKTEK